MWAISSMFVQSYVWCMQIQGLAETQIHCSSRVFVFNYIQKKKEKKEDIILGEMSNLQAFLLSLLIKWKFSEMLLGVSISQDSVDFRRTQLHFAPWVCFYTGIVHTLLHVKMHNHTCWSRDLISVEMCQGHTCFDSAIKKSWIVHD